MASTANTAFMAGASRGGPRSAFPPFGQTDAQPVVIDDPLHDEVDELTDLLRFLVEAGRRRKDDGTRLRHRGHVAEMHERERRLTRDEDELASLFERHVRGPLDQRPAGAVRNRRARAD